MNEIPDAKMTGFGPNQQQEQNQIPLEQMGIISFQKDLVTARLMQALNQAQAEIEQKNIRIAELENQLNSKSAKAERVQAAK